MKEVEILTDIPRIYTALAEWLSCMVCLLEVKHRLKGFQFGLAAAVMLVAQSAFLVLTAGQSGMLWILCMVIAVGMMYMFIRISADLPWRDCVYYCIRAFVMAEFAASIEWQMEYYLLQKLLVRREKEASIVLLVLIFSLVFIICARLYYPYRSEKGALNITNKEMISSLIIALSVFVISNGGYVSAEIPFAGSYAKEIYNVRTLVDLGGIAIMYAYHVQRVDLRVRHEFESVQAILHNQYAQYKQAREAIDLINYKYHDLKHHLVALRAEEDTEKRNAYLDQMEEELQNYEAQNKTGNKILDVMLTTKSQYCQKHGITMTCVVDGTLFEFMQAMDICSIFGNALDNAIQSVLKIPDKTKRMIQVSAYSQKNFLIIRFENYYEGEIKFDNDLPLTTKEDARFHGYGLKSIRYTVQKYGGAVDISTQKQWFQLKILIPIVKQEDVAKSE